MRTTSHQKRFHLVAFGAVLMATLLLTSCGNSSNDEEFWNSTRITGNEVEPLLGFADMARSADVVVLATLAPATSSRRVGGNAQDAVDYLQVTVQVEKVLAGSAPSSRLPLEFLVSVADPRSAKSAINQLSANLPDGQMVLFLREKRGDGEAGLYRVVNSRGLWTRTERGAVDAPLSEDNPKEDPTYNMDLSTAGDLGGLVALVDRAT